MAHRVRKHVWDTGVLRTIDHFFEELAEAIDFANKQDGEHIRVYDHEGQLVHSVAVTPTTTYA
jgi:hypothetical protein